MDVTQWPVIGQALALLTALGGVSGATVLVNNRLTRRKLAAEAEKVEAEADKTDAEAAHVQAQSLEFITNAARSLIEPLERRVTTQQGELTEVRTELNAMRHEMHVNDRLAAEHSGWDYLAEEKMREHGIPYPPRPPLRRTEALYPTTPVPAAGVSVQVTGEATLSP